MLEPLNSCLRISCSLAVIGPNTMCNQNHRKKMVAALTVNGSQNCNVNDLQQTLHITYFLTTYKTKTKSERLLLLLIST